MQFHPTTTKFAGSKFDAKSTNDPKPAVEAKRLKTDAKISSAKHGKTGAKPDKNGAKPDKSGAMYDKSNDKDDKSGAKHNKSGDEDDKSGSKHDKSGDEDDKGGAKPDKRSGKTDKHGAKPDKRGGKTDKHGAKPNKGGGKTDKSGAKPDKLHKQAKVLKNATDTKQTNSSKEKTTVQQIAIKNEPSVVKISSVRPSSKKITVIVKVESKILAQYSLRHEALGQKNGLRLSVDLADDTGRIGAVFFDDKSFTNKEVLLNGFHKQLEVGKVLRAVFNCVKLCDISICENLNSLFLYILFFFSTTRSAMLTLLRCPR